MENKQNSKNDTNSDESNEKLSPNHPNGNQCPICQNPMNNRSLTNTCLHEFCFECLSQSSNQSNRCPVCRRIFTSILHNINTITDFRQTPIRTAADPALEGTRIYITNTLLAIHQRLEIERDSIVQSIEDLNSISSENPNEETIRNCVQSLGNMLEGINTNIASIANLIEVVNNRTQPTLANIANMIANPLQGNKDPGIRLGGRHTGTVALHHTNTSANPQPPPPPLPLPPILEAVNEKMADQNVATDDTDSLNSVNLADLDVDLDLEKEDHNKDN